MVKFLLPFSIILILLFSCSTPTEKQTAESNIPENPLFKRLDSSQTGINFVNLVTDQKDFNVLTYRNFYNGGGVAIGDVNNDGLPDIYMTANLKANRLYLNKGNWQFEDISQKAGVEGAKSWSTGVSMVDINADGLLDIYVCNSGDIQGGNKENELFINQGDLTFKEAASNYGLNDAGFTTHASFFDYDGDGDLDAYILNNSFKDPARIDARAGNRETPDAEGGDRLYRNDGVPGTEGGNGKGFTDATLEAGIYSSEIGFGLGVSVSDLNQDMLPDLYISNDFWERDYLYLNNGDGTFSEELTSRISLTSVSSMGSDIADINNDGFSDVFSTDMLAGDNYRLKAMTVFDAPHVEDFKYRSSYHYQILQNCLQVNNGNAEFQEVAHLSGVAATDWSWGALIFDFENDGWKDILVCNGIGKDIMYMDFTAFLADKGNVDRIVKERGSFDWRDFVPYIPSNPLQNYAFSNQKDLTFSNEVVKLGLGEESFSNGAAYGDLDGDGDMDLVVNNVNMEAFVYENQSRNQNNHQYLKLSFKGPEKNPFGIGAAVNVNSPSLQQTFQHFPFRGFQSSVEPGLLIGLGQDEQVSNLEITWPDGKMQVLENVQANQTLNIKYEDATDTDGKSKEIPATLFVDATNTSLSPTPRHVENVYHDFDHERLLPHVLSTEGPEIVKGDVNGDEREDFILLGAHGQADQLYLQQANNSYRFQESIVFTEDAGFESTCGALFDADQDGDNDLLIGAGGNEYRRGAESFILRYYENDGKGNFTKEIRKTPFAAGNFSTIAAEDFDQDGDQDLFIGARAVPGSYGLIPQSFFMRNDKTEWTNIAGQIMSGLGMVTDAVWTDFDNDGRKDLIVVGEWMAITIFKNEGKKLVPVGKLKNSEGWWNTIEAHDLDGDGDEDYVIGNWGLNTKFKASTEKPLSMYVKDFDQNDKTEFVLNWYPPLDEEAYPFATKGDITAQLPHLKKIALKFEDYAKLKYETMFTPEERGGAIPYVVNKMESIILWNNNGSFRMEPLPLPAQIAPVFSVLIEDLTNDDKVDILLLGNMHGLKPEVGRHDSNKGVLLAQTENGVFKVVEQAYSGLNISGEVRDVKLLSDVKGKKRILIARNNREAMVWEQNK